MKIDKRMSLETALELEAKGKARLFPAFGTCWTREGKNKVLVWSCMKLKQKAMRRKGND